MPNDEAAKFRRQADESREQTSKAVNPLDKEAWLRIARGMAEAGDIGRGTAAGVKAARRPLSSSLESKDDRSLLTTPK